MKDTCWRLDLHLVCKSNPSSLPPKSFNFHLEDGGGGGDFLAITCRDPLRLKEQARKQQRLAIRGS